MKEFSNAHSKPLTLLKVIFQVSFLISNCEHHCSIPFLCKNAFNYNYNFLSYFFKTLIKITGYAAIKGNNEAALSCDSWLVSQFHSLTIPHDINCTLRTNIISAPPEKNSNSQPLFRPVESICEF